MGPRFKEGERGISNNTTNDHDREVDHIEAPGATKDEKKEINNNKTSEIPKPAGETTR